METSQIMTKQEMDDAIETAKSMFSCKMAEGASVSAHFLKMKGYIDHLDKVGYPFPIKEIAIQIILNSLPQSYSNFVMIYNMNNMKKSIFELHAMLKYAESFIARKPDDRVLMVKKGRVAKKSRKGKFGKSCTNPKVDFKAKNTKKGFKTSRRT